MRTILLALLAAVLLQGGPAANALDADLWDALLAEYTIDAPDVAGVRVDYQRLGHEPRWRTLLSGLAAAVRPGAGPEQLSFWINAYNILAIDVVLEHQPIESIRDAGSLLRPIWSRRAGQAAGTDVSLGEIEHEILRPLGDPRIHAAIVCASVSCPSLRREAYRPGRIEAQLDDAVRGFLADPRKGARLAPEGDALRVSRIFAWFDGDFDASGGVRAWLAPRLPEESGTWLRTRGDRARLAYFDYDWTLNAVSR
jgi:hypothetical protein